MSGVECECRGERISTQPSHFPSSSSPPDHHPSSTSASAYMSTLKPLSKGSSASLIYSITTSIFPAEQPSESFTAARASGADLVLSSLIPSRSRKLGPQIAEMTLTRCLNLAPLDVEVESPICGLRSVGECHTRAYRG